MGRLLIILSLLLYLPSAFGYPAYAHPWPHRSVIYFAPSLDEHVKKFELEALQHDCALTHRDVVTIIVTQDGYTQPEWIKQHFDLGVLFNLYRIDPKQHTTILIGKDGGEKLRWGKSTDWRKVKQQIDRMPMRQQEMLDQTDPCSI